MPDIDTTHALDGQDSQDATGRPVAAPDAADRLASARAAHAAAMTKHQDAIAQAGRAGELHRAVEGERMTMLGRIAGGEALNEVDLARSRAALVEAADIAAIHAAVAAGALKKVHETHIAVLEAGADDHAARTDAARREVAHAAVEADATTGEAPTEAGNLNALTAGLDALDQEALLYLQHELPQAVRDNPKLASRHPSEHPKLQRVIAGRPNLKLLTVRNHVNGHAIQPPQIIHSTSAGAR